MYDLYVGWFTIAFCVVHCHVYCTIVMVLVCFLGVIQDWTVLCKLELYISGFVALSISLG